MGNKTDLDSEGGGESNGGRGSSDKGARSGGRQITAEEGRTRAEEFGAAFIETSARTGANVKALFRKLAEALPRSGGGGGGDGQGGAGAAVATTEIEVKLRAVGGEDGDDDGGDGSGGGGLGSACSC